MDKYEAREVVRRAMEKYKNMLDKSESFREEIDTLNRYKLYEDSTREYSFSHWTLTEFDDGSFYLGLYKMDKGKLLDANTIATEESISGDGITTNITIMECISPIRYAIMATSSVESLMVQE